MAESATTSAAVATKSEAVPFDEDFPFPKTGRVVTICADSFNAWVAAALPLSQNLKEKDKIQVGPYRFYMREFPTYYQGYPYPFSSKTQRMRSQLNVYSGRKKARVQFSDSVHIPILQEEGKHFQDVWMSLTPNEIWSQRGQVRRTRGRVGVAGMGLGWVVNAMLRRKQVQHVTVVEKIPEVLSTFGTDIANRHTDRVSLVNGDAYQHDWSQYDVVVWDIWQSYGEAKWDDKFQQLKMDLQVAGKVCVGWGDCQVPEGSIWD